VPGPWTGAADAVEHMLTNSRTLSTCVQAALFVCALTLVPPVYLMAQTAERSPREWVREVVDHELSVAKEDSSHWMYRQHHVEPGKDEVNQCVETSEGAICRKLQQNGRDLSADEQAREMNRIQAQLTNPGERRKQEKARKEDAEKALAMMKILPTAFVYSFAASEGVTLHLNFDPNPTFKPQSREARILHEMSGTMCIDTRAKRLMELKGHLVQNIDFGIGLLGYLQKGGTFEVKRTDVGDDHWETTLLDVNIHGKALFFKSINAQQHEVTGYYHRVPDNLTLTHGVQLLHSPLASPAAPDSQALARSR
jgi:hypothetical protein